MTLPKLRSVLVYTGTGPAGIAYAGKLAGRLCLAEGLCHDDPTAG
ncbi:hypothetical protein PGR6_08560 [Pseudomonas sp. GR 6-02]|nr:hypothetical protein PGR6_08560 [Pseudomonas sp. GR 6-02]